MIKNFRDMGVEVNRLGGQQLLAEGGGGVRGG